MLFGNRILLRGNLMLVLRKLECLEDTFFITKILLSCWYNSIGFRCRKKEISFNKYSLDLKGCAVII